MKLSIAWACVLSAGCCLLLSSLSLAAPPYDFDLAGDVPPTPPADVASQAGTDGPQDLATLPAPCESCGSVCCCCCNWTGWANVLFWSRSGAQGTSLVYEDPKGAEIYDSEDLHFGSGWGPQFGVARCLDCCSSLAAEFFFIDGWSAGGQNDGNISVQFPSFPYLPELINPSDPNSGYGLVTFHYRSSLYSAEVNYRRRAGYVNWLTMLVGFRWLEMNEEFGAVFETGGTSPNFEIDTNNHLYGFQLGGLANVPRGPWCFEGWLKAGVYANAADQLTTEDFTSAGGQRVAVDASEWNTAFGGDLGVSVRRCITDRLSARVGYMAMWLEGVALAPDQLDNSDPSSATASLDNSGGVFYHGAFAGFEYLW